MREDTTGEGATPFAPLVTMDAQNDAFRQAVCRGAGALQRTPGRLVVTRGVASWPPADQILALQQVAAFTAFTPDNDPYGEHDYGSFDLHGRRVTWKIDYYEDETCHFGAPSPAIACYRVLTVMREEDL